MHKRGTAKILSISGHVSIQDVGRLGFQTWGIPIGGSMDAVAAGLANEYVGNSPDVAVLEIGPGGLSVEVLSKTKICLTGSFDNAYLNEELLEKCQNISVVKGDRFTIQNRQRGGYCYLGFAGGIESLKRFGSSSYHPSLDMTPLELGSIIQTGDPTKVSTRKELCPEQKNSVFIKVMRGPEFDWLSTSCKIQLFSRHFSLTEDMSRVGFRLQGPRLPMEYLSEMISSPTFPGLVQLPPSGQPIIFMRDAPVTGGYPRILIVEEEGINQLARKKVGDIVKFVLCRL